MVLLALICTTSNDQLNGERKVNYEHILHKSRTDIVAFPHGSTGLFDEV